MYWLVQTICKTLALREIMVKITSCSSKYQPNSFLFLSRQAFNPEGLMRCIFLTQLLCIVKYQVARFWIRWFRQEGTSADDIDHFLLTSGFFFYVLKLLLAKILSFLTLWCSTIRSCSSLKGRPQLPWNCSVYFFPVSSLTWKSQSSWRNTWACSQVFNPWVILLSWETKRERSQEHPVKEYSCP